MRERRTTVRVPVGVEATYQVVQEGGGPHLAYSQDLSLGGIRITQPERIEPGREVAINFTLPKEGKVTLRGIVVWSRETADGRGEYQSGLRWTEVDPYAQARLHSFFIDRIGSQAPATAVGPAEISIPWDRVGAVVVLAVILGTIAYIWMQRDQTPRTRTQGVSEIQRNYEQLTGLQVNRAHR